MPRRYFHRADGNAKEIYGYLDKLGITYEQWGIADIVCGYGGLTMVAEIRLPGMKKEPRKSKTKGIKSRQEKFHERWTGGIYWLQTLEDCQNMKRTFIKWHNWIREGAMRQTPYGMDDYPDNRKDV